jgi:hypothetical protein
MTVLRREQLLGVALSACLCPLVGATVAANWQVSIPLLALAWSSYSASTKMGRELARDGLQW